MGHILTDAQVWNMSLMTVVSLQPPQETCLTTFVWGHSSGPRQMVITAEVGAYVGVRAHVRVFPPG